ncbi:TetR/AcrR family transcriptional regulator [Paenibacillus sanguinis]|uniref:TetR/AcrR family transcriptional regulator n=1 Tax=Paenibacillus sanguinis TaxID=225906 RepID=UPI00037D3536|nr:TetR/AcrR family transcriptional regulator [Paenibacillus sanguinis]
MQGIDKSTYFKILKLLSQKGTRFTTEDLARALGTSKRTVYTFFENKYDIIDKTIEFVFQEIGQSDREILADPGLAFPDKVRLYFQNIPDIYYIGILIRYADDLQRFYPELWDKTDHYIHSMWDELIHLVEKGMEDGVLHQVNTKVLRLMLDQTVGRLLDYEYTFKEKISFEAGMQAMCDIILFGLMDHKPGEHN